MNNRLLAGAPPTAVLAGLAGLSACSTGESAEPAAGSQPETETATETETVPREEGGKAEQEAEPAPESAPPLGAFTGLAGSDGVFAMRVNEAYVDDDGVITDGMGTTDRAADGSEFVIFNVQITNESSAPAYFDWGGSYAYDAEANQYVDDFDAALAACDTYCSEDLNPGASEETDVVFEMPQGAEIVSLELRSDPYGSGSPAVIEP
ncbi:hypothetical protein LP52_20225 [Streptomonospora alba]|uniref:DUF4352 domain-containing protein n=1 Tax=Streptomonospora alba TaxID=183763 RepID=A0A0C2G1V1_9ACTN|nr:DUF4352 domain-containing protein [Streptomonospora alba]KIH97293.1 hypothetical protein LP52_20225 [Streptomonospora alba]